MMLKAEFIFGTTLAFTLGSQLPAPPKRHWQRWPKHHLYTSRSRVSFEANHGDVGISWDIIGYSNYLNVAFRHSSSAFPGSFVRLVAPGWIFAKLRGFSSKDTIMWLPTSMIHFPTDPQPPIRTRVHTDLAATGFHVQLASAKTKRCNWSHVEA